MHSGIHTLDGTVRQISCCDPVYKRDLRPGDLILVTTKNSVYSIGVIGEERYSVSGGWFDLNGLSPAQTIINGCTFGGRAIKHDIVAARGLFLEFGNTVVTTRIQQVEVVRTEDDETVKPH